MSFWAASHGHRFDEAADNYFSALRQAGVSDGETARATDDYTHYVEALQELAPSSELYQSGRDAYARYADTVHDIWSTDGRRERAAAAYAAYVHALQDAWAAVDPERLDPAALATIAQAMMTVAGTAGLCAPVAPGSFVHIWTGTEEGVAVVASESADEGGAGDG